MKAIVIGGGIGGMAAALSLRNEGIEVEVYEQAQALSEIGAGLQIAPSAGRSWRDWAWGLSSGGSRSRCSGWRCAICGAIA